MKTKFIKFMLAGICIACSHLANAGLIKATDMVTVGGTEWAKTELFSGLGWNLINVQCPTGVCTATSSLNGFDMDGWIWASSDEVENMLNTFTTAGDIVLGDFTRYPEFDSAWAPAIIGAFGPTEITGTGAQIYALTSSEIRGYAQVVRIEDDEVIRGGTYEFGKGKDDIHGSLLIKKLSNNILSAFFYKSPTVVPEPSTLAIFALGMIGLASRRFKKQS
jgi:hypothetical protein